MLSEPRQNDLEVLQGLRARQQTLVEYFSQNEETIEKKVNDLGQIIEDRMKYADPLFLSEGLKDFTIAQISTYIANLFRSKGIKCADNVHHYLPSKWKDASQIRNNVTDSRGTEYRQVRQSLELLNNNQSLVLQVLEDAKKEEPSLISDSYELFHNGEIRTEKIAYEEGIPLVDRSIKREIKTRKPESEITTTYQAFGWLIEGLKKTQNFILTFPPRPEDDPDFASSVVELGKLLFIDNIKFSLWRIMWLSKIKYMTHHSKHGAAVKDEVMTMLCENCYDRKTGIEKPDTNAEMVKDPTSPTYWRCGSCRGVVGHWRGLTREQVGDNKEPYITQAEAFCGSMRYFARFIKYYSQDYMPYNGARKIELGLELSDLS